MTTNYDPIAEQYKRAKQQPWRTFVECYTLMELLGDVKGLAVLDVACGEGFYTRMIRQRGAARVVGVDLSQGMIELARSQEARHQLGVEFLVKDARELPAENQFDLVVAAYLLNYAHDQGELESMCDGIARSLKPGGRFVTVNSSPTLFYPSAPPRIANTDLKQPFMANGAKGCRSNGHSTWTMAGSTSRITT